MTGALVITGVPTKLGALLIEAAGVNLAAMVVLAFIFGAMLGTGLPPAPTYILVAIVIAPPMIQVGVNPWVVHFFAFFLGVWGELTPPTSLVAAVTAKIANASFYTTLNRALQICVSLFTLMAGVFVHPEPGHRAGLAPVRRARLLILIGDASASPSACRPGSPTARPSTCRSAWRSRGSRLSPCWTRTKRWRYRRLLPVCLLIGYWLLRRRVAASAAEAEMEAQPVLASSYAGPNPARASS